METAMSSTECCSSPTTSKPAPGTGAPWVVGSLATPAGPVNIVSTKWNTAEYFGAIRCRLSGFRMSYKIEPGLYATGTPSTTSPVFVTANYKLSFDHLRRTLATIDSWILVLDTRGINVWCAAGKKTFGTDELIRRITDSGLREIVSGKKCIVPQLGAPGIAAHEVKRSTGFSVSYGPVRAEDISRFMSNNQKTTPQMRLVRFRFTDRLILTPMELIPSLKRFLLVSVMGAVILGIEKEGILFQSIRNNAFPLLIAGFIALVTGTILTPAFLPFIPSRAFSVKGALTGIVTIAAYLPLSSIRDPLQLAATMLFFPLYSSFLTLNFTGSTPFTGMSGVKKEMKFAVPLYFAGTITAGVLLLIFKIRQLISGGIQV